MINRYRILGPYSQGGMSQLHLAIDEKTGVKCIIKTLLPQYQDDDELIKRLVKEGQILQRCHHRHIVSLLELGQVEGMPFLVMEYIGGVSLQTILRKDVLSFERGLKIFSEICQGILHLHALNIIHGDLTPSNILIGPGYDVKIIDFATAQAPEIVQNVEEKELAFLGSPFYMAPELKKNWRNVSFASDIYALGILAYELFSGRRFLGTIELQYIIPSFRSIIEKATHENIQDRYKTVDDFFSDFCSVVDSFRQDRIHPHFVQLYDQYGILVKRQEEVLNKLQKEVISGICIEYHTALLGPQIYFRTYCTEDELVCIVAQSEAVGIKGIQATLSLHELFSYNFNEKEVFEKIAMMQKPHSYAVVRYSPAQKRLLFSGHGFGYLFFVKNSHIVPVGLLNQEIALAISSSDQFFLLGMALQGEGPLQQIKKILSEHVENSFSFSEVLSILIKKVKSIGTTTSISLIYMDLHRILFPFR